MTVFVFPILFLLVFLPRLGVFLVMNAAMEPASQRVMRRRPCD